MAKFNEIPGIGSSDINKLGRAHIYTLEQLLNRCSDRHGRQTVASVTGIPEDQLLDWASKAELHSVKGIGKTYDHLLDATGIHSIADLGKANGYELYQQMRRVNQSQHFVKENQMPTENQIKSIVSEARKTNSKISY